MDSASGGIQFLGDKLVSWMSKKQNCTAMSSAEAEYVALSASCGNLLQPPSTKTKKSLNESRAKRFNQNLARVILFSIHNDDWKSFQCHHQTALRSVINELTSGEIVSLNFIESIKEARSRVQDLTSGEIGSYNVFILDPDGALMSTQEYMQKVVEDVGEDADFNSGAWVSATNYVIAFGGTVTGCLGDIDNFLKKGKLEQAVAIVKSCYPNALEDLNVTLKNLSRTVPGTIHYKVLDVGSYGKDITIGAAMILANVSVFTPKPSKNYLNITKRNVVEVLGSACVKP
ncbi:transposase, MuDR, MULE transposase domain protein [Tanacetum coccineum]